MNKKEIERNLSLITGEVRDIETNRLNSMLNPQPLGYDEDNDIIKIKFDAYDWEKNHRGEIHGGAVASMFDTSMGMSVIAYVGYHSAATADIDVSYIRPFTGESFVFEVSIVHPGRKIARVRAIARDEATGKVLASATANFVPYQK